MAIKQIGEILDAGKSIHCDLHRMVSERQNAELDEMYRMLLRYLQKRERDMQATLDELPGANREKIFNTFVRYYPQELEDQALKVIEDCEIRDSKSPVECLVEARQSMVEIYQFCADSAHIPEAEEFMRSLQVFESKQLQELNRQLSEYNTDVRQRVSLELKESCC